MLVREKIIAAFAEQLEQLIKVVESQHGTKAAARVRASIPPTVDHAKVILSSLDTVAAINVTEQLGEMLRKANESDMRLAINRIANASKPNVEFAGQMTLGHIHFYENVVCSTGRGPETWEKARQYWTTPGQKRQHTAHIEFGEIFRHFSLDATGKVG